MANSPGVVASFKAEILRAEHKFSSSSGHQFKFALYASTASLGTGTTAYSTTGEMPGTGNYTQGGVVANMENNPATGGSSVGYWTPNSAASWASLSASNFDAALLWNASHATSAAVAVFTFSNQVINGGNFSLSMPSNASNTALLRIL